MALSEGRVGLTNIGDGSTTALRFARDNALVTVRAAADAAARGKVFAAAMQSASNMGTALTATMITLALYNPPGSGVMLKLLNATVIPQAVSATGISAYLLCMNQQTAAAPTTVTAATMRCCDGSQKQPAGIAYTAATLAAAPIVIDQLGAQTAASVVQNLVYSKDYDGRIAIAEGTILSIEGITTQSTAIASMIWEEIPS